jgi:hypothetical protein
MRTNIEHRLGAVSAINASRSQDPADGPDRLDAATDQALAACGGDARQAVTALIVATVCWGRPFLILVHHRNQCSEQCSAAPPEWM